MYVGSSKKKNVFSFSQVIYTHTFNVRCIYLHLPPKTTHKCTEKRPASLSGPGPVLCTRWRHAPGEKNITFNRTLEWWLFPPAFLFGDVLFGTCRKPSWKGDLLGQWLSFKLFGITYLVGKIKFKLLFQGPLAKWGDYYLPKQPAQKLAYGFWGGDSCQKLLTWCMPANRFIHTCGLFWKGKPTLKMASALLDAAWWG